MKVKKIIISRVSENELREIYNSLELGGIIEVRLPKSLSNTLLVILRKVGFICLSYLAENSKGLGIIGFKFDETKWSFTNYNQLVRDTVNWCGELPKDFDYVVGIPRSGMLVATIIAQYMNIPLLSVTKSEKIIILQSGEKCDSDFGLDKNILIVDDSINLGVVLYGYKKLFNRNNHKFGALYYTSFSKKFLDYGFKKLDQLRIFEWNLFHHPFLQFSCMDIDGILCRDPTQEENDDGLKYEEFLKNVKLKYLPTKPINTLVTCRLEKYRVTTEDWLKKHKIEFNKLVMMDYPNRLARMVAGQYAEFKAKIYKESGLPLFIESSKWQAEKIAAITNKKVLCTEDMEVY